jgi:hypothetical protein
LILGAITSINPVGDSVIHKSILPCDLPFPKDDVRLSYYKDFIREYNDNNLMGLTTEDVNDKDQYIKPLTAHCQLSYCEMLKNDNHPAVGIATVFISHEWQYKFLDVLKALQYHFRDNPNIIVWFDLFSNNQHKAVDLDFDWWCGTFKSAIQQFGRTVMVLAPWNDPIPLKRAWCLFEIYCSIATHSKFEVAMSEEQNGNFIDAIVAEGQRAIDAMIAIIDTRNIVRVV